MRGVSGFRNAIGAPELPAVPRRYHLFVALNCQWCHRVTQPRGLLGLESAVTMDVAFPNRTGDADPAGPNLWEFAPERAASLTGAALPECTAETGIGNALRLARDIDQREGSQEQSFPILYDKHEGRIVNNESAEIIRMLDRHATALGSKIPETARVKLGAQTAEERDALDVLNTRIYRTINNGA